MKATLLFAVCALLFLSIGAEAQTKKRIAFKKKYAQVSAAIKGAETLEYVFRVRKNADLEIWVDREKTAGAQYPKFVLLKPDGKLFYDKDSVNYGASTDMMDILPQAGDYTIRLQLPAEMRGEGNQPVKFTLRLTLK